MHDTKRCARVDSACVLTHSSLTSLVVVHLRQALFIVLYDLLVILLRNLCFTSSSALKFCAGDEPDF